MELQKAFEKIKQGIENQENIIIVGKCKVKSIRYRGWQYKLALSCFAISFVVLGYLGTQPATGIYVVLARFFTIVYFLFFLMMPFYTRFEKTKPVPERVVYKK